MNFFKLFLMMALGVLLHNVACGMKDHFGKTPLHWAAWRGSTECMKLLIDKGALVNAQDDHGETPLHWAAWRGSTECMKLLIQNGADINAQDNKGETPLHWAAWHNKTECVRLLLDHVLYLNQTSNLELITYFSNNQIKVNQQFLTYLLCLKRKQKETTLKVPKFVTYEILSYVCPSCPSLKDYIDMRTKDGQTAWDLGNQKIKDLIKQFEK